MSGPVADVDRTAWPAALRAECTDPDAAWLFPPELADHLRPEMHDWSYGRIVDELLRGTGFDGLRMELKFGPITAVQCRAFPSTCYYAFVPLQLLLRRARRAPLVVSVHGSSRNAREFRDHFARFAMAHDCVVLAPLFPMDMARSAPDQDYTRLVPGPARADLALQAMADELAERLGLVWSRRLLFGFSGGAQFAQRFFHVHPDWVDALAVAAPGFVTMPWPDVPWPTGLAGLGEATGAAWRPEVMRRCPVLLVAGAQDVETTHVWTLDELGLDAERYARYGHDRVARLRALHTAWAARGFAARLELVPDTAHRLNDALLGAVHRFFAETLEATR